MAQRLGIVNETTCAGGGAIDCSAQAPATTGGSAQAPT
jgi:hypothetical protein